MGWRYHTCIGSSTLSIDEPVVVRAPRPFLQVSAGVQHAHPQAIIHPDLEPSNLLVTAQEGTPLVKIIDFGVAKATAQPLTEHSRPALPSSERSQPSRTES